MGKKHFVSLKHEYQSGARTRDLLPLQAGSLTTAPGPPSGPDMSREQPILRGCLSAGCGFNTSLQTGDIDPMVAVCRGSIKDHGSALSQCHKLNVISHKTGDAHHIRGKWLASVADCDPVLNQHIGWTRWFARSPRWTPSYLFHSDGIVIYYIMNMHEADSGLCFISIPTDGDTVIMVLTSYDMGRRYTRSCWE